MRKLTLAALVVAVTVIAAACGNSSSDLTGKTWQLTAISEKVPAFQGVVPAADQTKYTITFNKDGSFNAVADCNVVSGSYKTSGTSLTITLGPSTLVACPEGSYGDLFAFALARSKSYAVAGDQLTIDLDDGGILSFVTGAAVPSVGPTTSAAAAATATPTPKPTASPTPKPTPSPTPSPTAKPTTGPTSAPTTAPTATPAPTPPPTPAPTPSPTPIPGADLTGKLWQLTALTMKQPAFQGVVPPAQQQNYTLQFNTDGTFNAKADCNTVAGKWTATSAGGLTVTPGPSTIVACAEDSLGNLYVLAMSNAASYAIATNQLTITTVDQGTLVFAQGQ